MREIEVKKKKESKEEQRKDLTGLTTDGGPKEWSGFDQLRQSVRLATLQSTGP